MSQRTRVVITVSDCDKHTLEHQAKHWWKQICYAILNAGTNADIMDSDLTPYESYN